jgi:adenine-specific DNA-methyltransferase
VARLEDLLTEIDDGSLREALADEVKRLKKQVTFGLVFERHLPESVLVDGDVRVGIGDRVRLRKESKSDVTWEVAAVGGKTATLIPTNGASNGNPKTRRAAVSDLLVVRDFGDPIYPALTSLGEVRRSEERLYHAVIDAENYHALEALIYACEGQVDCILIDPPYNTGARDWRYNNDYVDGTDTYRHSKWLSFMEKRLRLAKRLLKPDGVLVVTVDEHEGSHLGVLLETMFPDALRQMVTICINPSGASRGEGLSRVDEYAYFCFLEGTQPSQTDDDMLVSGGDVDLSKTGAQGVRWEWLMRGGNAWYQETRPNLCYPILLSKDGTRIVGAGEPYAGPAAKRPKTIDGHPVAWPVRKDGKLGIWRVDGTRLTWLAEKGYAYVSNRDEARGTWTLKYLMTSAVEGIEGGSIEVVGRGKHGEVQVRVAERKSKTAKTMWYRGRHTAGGGGGTQLLSQLLGKTDLFPFPKSVYAVQDCLQVAVGDRPNAFIIDFFAGSGTTLHAVTLMNAADGGNRRCMLVTNNEVDEKRAKQLNAQGHYRGDPEFERHGIFEAVTRPRCEAAITGTRADGQPVSGSYLGGRALANGFEENCEFLRLGYLDPDEVELGRCFAGIHPLLWLRAGSRGPRPQLDPRGSSFAIVTESGYAVLFDETALREFVVALNDAPEAEWVFLVTDSEDAFAEMCLELGPTRRPEMLYRDYIRTFRSLTSPIG